MKIVEFLKCLIFPRKMIRFRYSTVFIALLIFILSSYLLVIPADYSVKHNFDKNINENNLLYLQSLTELKSKNKSSEEQAAIDKLFEEISEKKLYISNDDRLLQAENMVFDNLKSKDNSILGIMTKNSVDGNDEWIFNNSSNEAKETNIKVHKQDPVFSLEDGYLYIDGVKGNYAPYLTQPKTASIETFKITVNTKGLVEITNTSTNVTKDTGIFVKHNNNKVSIKDNEIYFNDEATGVKTTLEDVLFTYEDQKDIQVYENIIEYTNEKGTKINITFVIDLTGKNYDVSTEFDYEKNKNTKFTDIYNTRYFLVLFNYNHLYYQAHPYGISNDHDIKDGKNVIEALNHSTFYTSADFDASSFGSTDITVNTIMNVIKKGYFSKYNTLYSIITFIFTVIFPLFIAFIFWLFFKRNGKLKKLREYYNIAGITNIVCSIVVFGILWFYPDGIGNVYPFLFAIYYLFVLYRINSTPEKI